MDITITPRKLHGSVSAIASKSQAHRLLICAAFADRETVLHCPQTNRDIEATAECLRALGADVLRTDIGYRVVPLKKAPETAILHCGESGSTLRFMLPIVGALGVDATFIMEARLPQRPLSPLWEEMEQMGCHLSRPAANTLRCQGQLQGGEYVIDGGVSSQFITGLLFAGALMTEDCRIRITGKLESEPYVNMTQKTLALFGIQSQHYIIPAGQKFVSPGSVNVEGDWSNGAFFMAATALGSDITVTNLSADSPQGDRAVSHWLEQLRKVHCIIDATDIPDLVPVLAVVATAASGTTRITGASRLRLKESDRIASTAALLRSLGADVEELEDGFLIRGGKPLHGGRIDTFGDHRIAMSAAVASLLTNEAVVIPNADCTKKSYPTFFEDVIHAKKE
jgi:3-phosphoshikimate 1-carboxyvinyltransferase